MIMTSKSIIYLHVDRISWRVCTPRFTPKVCLPNNHQSSTFVTIGSGERLSFNLLNMAGDADKRSTLEDLLKANSLEYEIIDHPAVCMI